MIELVIDGKTVKLSKETEENLRKQFAGKTWAVGDTIYLGNEFSSKAVIMEAGHNEVVFVNPDKNWIWNVNNFHPYKVNDSKKITKKELTQAGFGCWNLD